MQTVCITTSTQRDTAAAGRQALMTIVRWGFVAFAAASDESAAAAAAAILSKFYDASPKHASASGERRGGDRGWWP